MAEDKKKDPRGAAMVVIIIGLSNLAMGFTALNDKSIVQAIVVGSGALALFIGAFYFFRAPKKS